MAWVAVVAATMACGCGGSSSGPAGTTSVGGGDNGGGSGGTAGGGGGGGSGGTTGGGGSGGSGGGGGSGGAMCFPTATRLAPGTHIPGPVAVDATSVYFADQRSAYASIHRVAKSGGPDTVLGLDGLALNADNYEIHGLAVDGDGVYWSSWYYWHNTSAANGEAYLYAYRFADGGSTALGHIVGPVDLAVDGGTIYYSASDGLYAIPTAGGTPRLLARLYLGRLAIDPWNVFVISADGLFRVSRSDGSFVKLADNTTSGSAVAVDTQSAYIVDLTGRVRAVDAPLATPRVLYPGGNVIPHAFIRRVGTQLYFSSDRGLARMSTDGSGFTVLSAIEAADAVADDAGVYFSHDDEVDALCR